MNEQESYGRRHNKPDVIGNIPAGEWIEVPKGMIPAVGAYIDSDGVLRDAQDHSCVVWHNPGCQRRGITPEEIVYDPMTKAPHCPDCWRVNHKLPPLNKPGSNKNRKARRENKFYKDVRRKIR